MWEWIVGMAGAAGGTAIAVIAGIVVLIGIAIYVVGFMHRCRVWLSTTSVTIAASGTVAVDAILEEQKGLAGSWVEVTPATYVLQTGGNAGATQAPAATGKGITVTIANAASGTTDFVKVTGNGGKCTGIASSLQATLN